MSTLLTVDDLTIAYGTQQVVHPLSFTLQRGQTLALAGESGCGKTSIAMAIAGLLPTNARVTGKVIFENENLLELNRRQLRRYQGKEIGVVFQEPLSSLNPVLSVQAQIDEVLRTHTTLPRRQRVLQITELLQRVGLPLAEELQRRYPHELSGGQRQRVMIAMAIACSPKLLIADEPTTALDVTTQKHILELLKTLQTELNMAVLLISHDLAVVNEHADHLLIMRSGQVQESGLTQEVLSAPAHPYTSTLIRASLPIDANLHYQDHEQPIGQKQRIKNSTSPLLEVKNLHKSFGSGAQRHTAIDNLSLQIQPNETVGLVGESGCGKSTLSRIIMGLQHSDGGSIVFSGQPVTAAQYKETPALRQQIQMVFQDPYGSLNPRWTIGRLFDRLQRLHFPQRSAQAREQQSLSLIDAVRLPAHALKRYPYEFSGGQRQRIAIARCLLLKPRLLICDEPVSALDVSVQEQILNLFIELKHEFDLAYLFISHDLAVVRYIADRILVMHKGQIVETHYYKSQTWSPAKHPYSQRLLAAIPRFSHSLA